MNHSVRAFTLIELSIVLVIIGLIVGGILTGQELIHSATLKSVITDEQKYITAVNTFRTKYNELPGDMLDATNYWGADAWCPSGGNLPTDTCNGNGNGMIEDIESAAGGYARRRSNDKRNAFNAQRRRVTASN